MALFPGRGSTSFDDKDYEIQKRMEDFYRNSISVNQSFWGEADIDTRFEAGDQQIMRDLYNDHATGRRRSFNFNHIRRIINMISGHQRRERKSTIVVPVENADEETATQFTKILSWCSDQEGILHSISEAFHGALVTGLNLLQVWMDYRTDPVSGNIKVDCCSYNSFLIDPYFRKKDLSDCNGIWKRSYLTRREVVSLLPDYKEELMGLNSLNLVDGKFEFMPENYDVEKTTKLAYDEYYYKAYRTQQMLVDTESGESMEWTGNDDTMLKAYLRTYPQVTVIDQEIPTINMAIVVQGKVFYDGLNPLGTDKYPFVPVFGYYNPQLSDYANRIQGVVRGLRDPQYLYNRKKVTECDIFESKATTGYFAKEDAVVDPKDLYKTGQGRTIILKKTAQMTDVVPIPTQDIPPGYFQASAEMAQDIMTISGANEELLGSATDDKAGILSMLRQSAGIVTLEILFDQLDYSQKLVGKVMIDIIQSNFTPGKVKRIIEDEPAPQFYNKAFGRYDSAVEEGLNTTTQRQNQFAQLLHLRKEAEIPIPDEVLIEAATVQNKKKLTDAIAQVNEQKAKSEEMQMQVTLEEAKARTNLANKRAFADEGLGIERISRVEENHEMALQQRAEAEREKTQAMLNLTKTLQEMETVDLDQLGKLVTLSQLVQSDIGSPGATASPTPKPQAASPISTMREAQGQQNILNT